VDGSSRGINRASRLAEIRVVSQENRKPQDLTVRTGHVTQSPNTSQGGASLSIKVRLPSMKPVQPIWSQPPASQWRWKQPPMSSAGLPQEVTVGLHMPSSSEIQWACYKKWKGKPRLECVGGWHYHQKLQWVHCPGHAGVKGNDWADRLVGKATSQVVCFLEDLKCWEAWDTTCRHKAKDITPSIAWRREAWK